MVTMTGGRAAVLGLLLLALSGYLIVGDHDKLVRLGGWFVAYLGGVVMGALFTAIHNDRMKRGL